MGGNSGGRGRRRAGSGGGGGGGSPGGSGEVGELLCPSSLTAVLVGPAAGACSVGDVLDVTLITAPPPGRAVCVHRATAATVGAIAGIPGLARFLDCLAEGVVYEAQVDAIVGGRIDVTVRKI